MEAKPSCPEVTGLGGFTNFLHNLYNIMISPKQKLLYTPNRNEQQEHRKLSYGKQHLKAGIETGLYERMTQPYPYEMWDPYTKTEAAKMRRNCIMKMNGKKAAAMIGTVVLAMSSLAGCAGKTAETTPAAAETKTEAAESPKVEAAESTEEKAAEDTSAEAKEEAPSADLSGSISMVGSTSMEKFANALAESFMAKYPKVTVTAEFVGSGAGVEAVLGGTADIGNASRDLTEEEKGKGAAENIVAIDGIAVIVDPANTAEDLTKQQLADIYEGKITNWKDAGGSDAPIVVVGREAGSGTRSAFEELLELKDKCKYSNELDSTGAVMAKVASTPGAIGYVSLDVLDDTVKAVKLEGTEATEENIKAGSYFLSRPFVMATKGEVSEQSDLVKALFDYIHSEEGQEIIKAVGLIVPEN